MVAALSDAANFVISAGDCHGDASSTAALVAAGVRRVVVGMRHPLPHFRGQALQAYSAAGLAVEVLGESPCQAGLEEQLATLQQCLKANEGSCGAAGSQGALVTKGVAWAADRAVLLPGCWTWPALLCRVCGLSQITSGRNQDSNLTVALSAHATPCDFVLQALLHRAVTGKPLGVFKYAMTLDGKIATSSGHSAWVSSSTSRQQVTWSAYLSC